MTMEPLSVEEAAQGFKARITEMLKRGVPANDIGIAMMECEVVRFMCELSKLTGVPIYRYIRPKVEFVRKPLLSDRICEVGFTVEGWTPGQNLPFVVRSWVEYLASKGVTLLLDYDHEIISTPKESNEKKRDPGDQDQAVG